MLKPKIEQRVIKFLAKLNKSAAESFRTLFMPNNAYPYKIASFTNINGFLVKEMTLKTIIMPRCPTMYLTNVNVEKIDKII